MTKFRVYYTTTASSFIEVEADDADEARVVADDEWFRPSICAQCSGWGQSDAGIELGDDWEQDESAYGVTEA